MNGYLLKHITYPHKAHEEGIQDTVFIQFTINKNGSITDTEVVKGIGGGCDEEGIRLVKAMPK
ncbi:MAG: TonB family protein [Bacteroidetes Order II. Incertae sedis bacterium]|nr:TonB family protein [Bacteroidetes Order II. bacterium]